MPDLPPLSLDPALCRQRQRRLAAVLQALDADRAVLTLPEHVQYLTGFRPHRLMRAAVSLDADGFCLLAAPNEVPPDAAADAVVTFPAQWHATLRQEQAWAAAVALGDALRARPRAKRLAVEFSAFPPSLAELLGVADPERLLDVESGLWRQRRKKDADELALIGRAVACTEAMYARAREVIRPGVTELEVFNELQAAAVRVAGEPLSAPLGNDYQCGTPGGPPRPRPVEAGELYVLDLGPCYRGYYADNCRTFAVDRRPTDEQHRAWAAVVAVLDVVEKTVRPGVSCRELFDRALEMLDGYRPGAFVHHLGHGIGLYPHEAPHLNPHWDDAFAEGDVFTAEPGLYGPELRGGIRLEQDYRVTADGVERLTAFPLEL